MQIVVLRNHGAWVGVWHWIARLLVRDHVMPLGLEVAIVVRLEGMRRLVCVPGHHLLRSVGGMMGGRILRTDGALRCVAPLIGRVARPRGGWAVCAPVEVGLALHDRVVVAGRRALGNLRHGGVLGVAVVGLARAIDAVLARRMADGCAPVVHGELLGGGGGVAGVEFVAGLPVFFLGVGVVDVVVRVVRVGEGFLGWCRACYWPASFSVHGEERAGY